MDKNERIIFDKKRLIHNEKCRCNMCLSAIISGYGYSVGDLVMFKKKKCKIYRILPPEYKNTCKLLICDTESMWMDWLNDEERTKLKKLI